MSLVNRVSAFFLAALGVCLLGYSATMYGLIREHLYHQFDADLTNALNVLVAAIEVEEDGAKWQPSDHTITLGNERDQEEVRWIIVDERRQIVDASTNLSQRSRLDQQLFRVARSAAGPRLEFREEYGWRLIRQELRAPVPKPIAERDLDEFATLEVIVAREAQDLHSELSSLFWLACALPTGLWILAAVAGRAYCRRALRPVGEMAREAQSITAADFSSRIPLPDHRDELSELARSFNELLDRLQQAYVQQQRFTGDAAHQLRTPLTVLRGEIDLALRRPRTEVEYRETLSQLSRQTDELQQIVEALLFLARSTGEMAIPNQEKLFLAHWLPQYIAAGKGRLNGADIQLRVDGDPNLITSPPLLRQALDNLLSNAIKYSPPGSPVGISAKQSNGTVEFSIEDQGSGIPLADQESIFDPFYRSTEARRSGVAGTGLGLAIVRQITTALGGEISFSSHAGQGTRFTLRFPAHPPVSSPSLRA